MRTLDYIRIVGISDSQSKSNGDFDITFNIEYSEDSSFDNPKRGIFTIRMSDFMDSIELENNGLNNIASRLVRQVLVRKKDEEGSVRILHLHGMTLAAWLNNQ